MAIRKYLVIQRSVEGGKREVPLPSQMQEMYAAFNAWKEKFKAEIVDMGAKLKPGGKIVTPAGVADGPFVEAKEVVGGYMVLAAEDYERAIECASECPGLLSAGNRIEIREIATP